MKKILFIFLMALLPLQFSWAAAASYCQHEEGKAAQHFGHHLHKHKTAADQDAPAKVHNDCGYCHFACQATPITATPHVLQLAPATHITLPQPAYSSHIPDGPRRPDRHPVAWLDGMICCFSI